MTKPNIGVQIATLNPCYSKYAGKRTMKPKRVVVHSTGCNNSYLKRFVGPNDGVLGENPYKNTWNRTSAKACVHAFIGKTLAGEVRTYQTLPWDMCAWGCASGSKGSYNYDPFPAIQFEMCEDGLNNRDYWQSVRAQAVHLCAWLCQEYGIPVSAVVSHREAHAAGYANNHGDPHNWMNKFGDSMDKFRADVQAMLRDGTAPEGASDNTEGDKDMDHYIGTVQTKKDGRISLWSDVKKSKRLCYVNDGEQVEVLGEVVVGTMAPATAKGYVGFADTQYLVNHQPCPHAPEGGTKEEGSEAMFTGEVIVIRSDNLAGMLEALHNAVIVGVDDEDLSGE